MNLFIRDTNRDITTMINDAISTIWQVEYTGTGNFEIRVPYTKERFALLAPDNYVTRNDRDEIGFIENLQLDYSPQKGRIITISGRFGCVLLARRIWYSRSGYKCRQVMVASGTKTEVACRRIVSETLTSAQSERLVSWLSLGPLQNIPDTTSQTIAEQRNALVVAREMLRSSYYNGYTCLGHKVTFDPSTKAATYDVFKGQTTNLIFSQAYNNLLTFKYSYDKSLFKNRFLIAGNGEGAEQFFALTTRGNPQGEQTREYVYKSNISKTWNDDNDVEHTFTDAQYSAALIRDCKAQFSEYSTQEKISGTVDLSSYKYGEDYNVGDIVKIRDFDTSIETNARIWSVTEVEDENGYKVEANFEGESND